MASSPAQTTCVTPQQLDGWHFPFGPSSKYHASQRTRPANHTRYKSSYTPTAPVLSTELRAHRRTRSSITVATASSPTPRDHAVRSPLALMDDTGPHTPERRRRRSIEPHGSPFSDYFTDENRSITTSSFHTPSAATQQLLVRLSRLQAHLMREDTPTLFHIVERKMNEIDLEVKAVEDGDHMRDSGLFIEEEDLDRTENPSAHHVEPVIMADVVNDGEAEVVPEGVAKEDELELDLGVAEARQVLESITQAQLELRQRLQEMSELRLSMDEDDPEEDGDETEEDDAEDFVGETAVDLTESSQTSENAYGAIEVERNEEQDEGSRDGPEPDAGSDTMKSAWKELWEGLYDLAGMSSLDP